MSSYVCVWVCVRSTVCVSSLEANLFCQQHHKFWSLQKQRDTSEKQVYLPTLQTCSQYNIERAEFGRPTLYGETQILMPITFWIFVRIKDSIFPNLHFAVERTAFETNHTLSCSKINHCYISRTTIFKKQMANVNLDLNLPRIKMCRALLCSISIQPSRFSDFCK